MIIILHFTLQITLSAFRMDTPFCKVVHHSNCMSPPRINQIHSEGCEITGDNHKNYESGNNSLSIPTK
jgi:hypothetical protein